jgi:hypothetical protein
VSAPQRKALRDIGLCRTAALGGHVEQWDHCSQRTIAYNSCRNRHCPQCQSTARDRWLAERAQELRPVPYGPVVFTVPQELAPWALQNQRLFYNLLFRAVSQTLLEIAAHPRHLAARIGFLAVLPTGSQNLRHHPPLHCVVPAAGMALDGSGWIACRRKFFLPVRVLSRVFRGKLLAFLAEAHAQKQLEFFARMQTAADPVGFNAWRQPLRKKEWVVYAKPPFGGPDHVLHYLARYTHRVAIANGRLLERQNEQVRFRWRDSPDGNRCKILTLDALEFIRRFLLHLLPPGFVKIRHCGFLANRNRSQALALCRQHLQASHAPQPPIALLTPLQKQARERRCPLCQRGTLRILVCLSVQELAAYRLVHPINSS